MSTAIDSKEWLRTPWGWYTGRDDISPPPHGAVVVGKKRFVVLTNGIALAAVRCDDLGIPALNAPGNSMKKIREIMTHKGSGELTVALADLQNWAGPFQPRVVPCFCGPDGCDDCEGERELVTKAAYRYGFVVDVPLNQNVLAEVLQYFTAPETVRLTNGTNNNGPMLIVDALGEWRVVVMGCRVMPSDDPLNEYQPPVEQWAVFPKVRA